MLIYIYLRGIQALQVDVLLSPSCKIRFLVSQVYVTIDIHVYFTWISVEEVYSHASNANASMIP